MLNKHLIGKLSLFLIACAAVSRADIVVNTTTDEVDANPGDGSCETSHNTCSLRAAIQEANRAQAPQTIILPAGYYKLSIPPTDESLENRDAAGDLDLMNSMTLVGADRASVIVDAAGLSRVFDVQGATSAVTIRQMTIRGGKDTGGGGVQQFTGSLTLDHVIVEDNESAFFAGGVYISGVDVVLKVLDSMIVDNRGGGIESQFAEAAKITVERSSIINNQKNEMNTGGTGLRAFGTVRVLQSTISENQAGGLTAYGLELVESTVSGNSSDVVAGGVLGDGLIVNSTISGNRAATFGGGVVADRLQGPNGPLSTGQLQLSNVTIANNLATSGGNALYVSGGGAAIRLQNSILANPNGTECASTPTSLGHNLVSDASCNLSGIGDKQGVNALIGALKYEGGTTEVHPLLPGSPAIDAAANVGLVRDQRGVSRPQGSQPDIGAVERKY